MTTRRPRAGKAQAAPAPGGAPPTPPPADGEHDLPFVDAAHSLAGSPTDNYRHAVVRSAFTAELCTHSRVIEEFNRWGDRTGIIAAAEACATSMDAAAQAIGLPSRSALLDPTALDQAVALAVPNDAAFRRVRRQAIKGEKAAKRFAGVLGRRLPDLRQDAEALTRELLRPGWPWVTYDLVETFALLIQGYAIGAPDTVLNHWVGDPAPAVTMTFATAEGEDRGSAMQRLTVEYLAAAAKLAQRSHDAKRGRLPRGSGYASLTRDARWFYRHHVVGEKADDLTREYCDAARSERKHPHRGSGHTWRNDRKTITDGIARAKRLLGEIPQYVWRD